LYMKMMKVDMYIFLDNNKNGINFKLIVKMVELSKVKLIFS
jgi:hypothetical protein